MIEKPETFHVALNPKGGWDVKRGGARRASSQHDNKNGCIAQSDRHVGGQLRRKG